MGVERMTGTPWHLETLHKTDDRRHKSWCTNYVNGRCRFYNEKCRGSAHCDKYYKIVESTTNKHIDKQYPDVNKLFAVGDKVQQRYFSQGKFQRRGGIVTDIDKSDCVSIKFTDRFKNCRTVVYHYPEMLDEIEPHKSKKWLLLHGGNNE